MQNFYRLCNEIKNYAWGSPDWISELCGKDNSSREPWAELWMGVHPGGPSLIEEDGENISLGEAISRNPDGFLGSTAKTHGTLPFLFKILAAAKPLSIQTHPSLAVAKEGFERENRRGIALNDPNRNYKDSNHKPEIISALTPFTALCGFRVPEEIGALLSLCDTPCLKEPIGAVKKGDLRNFLICLLNLEISKRKQLTDYITKHREALINKAPSFKREWELSFRLGEEYPGDPAIIAPLYMNLIELKPGEAIYLPAGELHSYIYGLGVELMANSDNVLRGGLTPKNIDIGELCSVLSFIPKKPEILYPGATPVNSALFTYHTECSEFSLSTIKGSTAWPLTGPAIVLITEGRALLSDKRTSLEMDRGSSAFIPAGAAETLSIEGSFSAYVASPGGI